MTICIHFVSWDSFIWTVFFFFVVAWFNSNYLSPTIYVLSEIGATSIICAYRFILPIFSMQAVGLLNIFLLKL